MKNLQKLADLYQELTNIDKEILKIEKIANKLLFEKVTQEFTLTLSGASPEEKASIFDEDGSLKNKNSRSIDTMSAWKSMFFLGSSEENTTKDNKEPENELSGNLSSKMSITFINMLLIEMNKKRTFILKKANKIMNSLLI